MQVTAESQASHILLVQAQQLQFDTSQRPHKKKKNPHFSSPLSEENAGTGGRETPKFSSFPSPPH